MEYLISAFICFSVVAADVSNIYLPPTLSRTTLRNGNIIRPLFNQRSSQSISYATSGNFRAPQPGSLYGASYKSPIESVSPGFRQPAVAILRLNNENKGDGTYQFDFETENKISQKEFGQLKNVGSDEKTTVVQGSYSYVGTDGKTYTVNYVADEFGFRASGDHFPVAPPVPEAILKSLEKNAAEEVRGIVDNGQYRSEGYGSKGGVVNAFERQYLAPVHSGYQQKKQNGYRY